MTSQPQREDLIDIARGAGEILRLGFGKQHQIESKTTDIDLVTEIDLQSEKYLLRSFSAQVSGPACSLRRKRWFGQVQGKAFLYIDPVDGTVNYAHGLPIFTVSAGLRGGGMRCNWVCVYDPMREEVFSAERGKGAWLNNVPIQVSGAKELKDCLLVSRLSLR